MKLVALRRYPLKSALGEHLDAADVEPTGLLGDRTWACVDVSDGTIGSAKHPRRWGNLLEVATELHGSELTLRIAGRAHRAGSAEADAALSELVGRPVRLTQEAHAGAQLHRVASDVDGMIPEWTPDLRAGDESVSDVGGIARVGRFTDFGAIHLLTTGALARLGERLGGTAVADARFRANLILEAPDDPAPGDELRLGDVVLRIVMPTPRCVIPGLGQAGIPADRALLSTLARHYRRPVADFGRGACFGVYADVVQPGRLQLDQIAH
ncbi:MOSC domain-containing protein [Actinoplanes friuliensis]|uniref:MOSC domain-containing protein n=1 Tax=Actinoplanes friuliensis DSM 7358 TaxID=1246995 RepID=U5VTK7_9ACTN|nr:MOSC domain-containing protein [Actinoplanes friuliensis]AGZ38996.1 hypothetical protein AFR_03535 [Actinoplanes friuliensis DSM 7358]